MTKDLEFISKTPDEKLSTLMPLLKKLICECDHWPDDSCMASEARTLIKELKDLGIDPHS